MMLVEFSELPQANLNLLEHNKPSHKEKLSFRFFIVVTETTNTLVQIQAVILVHLGSVW